MNDNIINELSSPGVFLKLKDVPITYNIDTFIANAQPADIILSHVTGTDEEKLKPVIDFVVKSAQWSPYVSSKLVTGRNELSGFVWDDIAEVGSRKFDDYMKMAKQTVIMTCPTLTDTDRRKIIKFVYNKRGTPYDHIRLLNSAVSKYLPFLKLFYKNKNEEITQENIDEFAKKLICSTIISLAYIYGANISFTDDPLNVWPRDILVSNHMVPILRYMR